jgi:hypothetical protein
MHEFLIHCSFKQYSMALKFDLLIQCYAILILRYAAWRRTMIVLCGIAQDLHTNSIQKKKSRAMPHSSGSTHFC